MKVSDSSVVLARRLRGQGWTLRRVAKLLRVSVSTAHYWLSREELPSSNIVQRPEVSSSAKRRLRLRRELLRRLVRERTKVMASKKSRGRPPS